MKKDLTTSDIHRINVLNHRFALQKIEDEIALPGLLFEHAHRFTEKQVVSFFEENDKKRNSPLKLFEALVQFKNF